MVALGADYDLSATPGLVEGGNEFFPNRTIRLLDPSRHVVVLDDETEMPYDLFLGVPKHRVPDVVSESGLAEDGWIPVDPDNLKTKFPGVYAVGDVTSVGTPKAAILPRVPLRS